MRGVLDFLSAHAAGITLVLAGLAAWGIVKADAWLRDKGGW